MLEIPQSIFPCVYTGEFSHILGKVDQCIPGQFVFSLSKQVISPRVLVICLETQINLELLMSPGKSLKISLKVYGGFLFVRWCFCLFFPSAFSAFKNHPSQMGFCIEVAVEECH